MYMYVYSYYNVYEYTVYIIGLSVCIYLVNTYIVAIFFCLLSY